MSSDLLRSTGSDRRKRSIILRTCNIIQVYETKFIVVVVCSLNFIYFICICVLKIVNIMFTSVYINKYIICTIDIWGSHL